MGLLLRPCLVKVLGFSARLYGWPMGSSGNSAGKVQEFQDLRDAGRIVTGFMELLRSGLPPWVLQCHVCQGLAIRERKVLIFGPVPSVELSLEVWWVAHSKRDAANLPFKIYTPETRCILNPHARSPASEESKVPSAGGVCGAQSFSSEGLLIFEISVFDDAD